MHINQNIILFSLPLDEKVKEYICFIGHSDTPRAYLVTNKNAYFFDTNQYISKICLSKFRRDLPTRALYAKYIYYPKNSTDIHDMEFDKIFSYYKQTFSINTSRFQELDIIYHRPQIDRAIWSEVHQYDSP